MVPLLLGILRCHDPWKVLEIQRIAEIRRDTLRKAFDTKAAMAGHETRKASSHKKH